MDIFSTLNELPGNLIHSARVSKHDSHEKKSIDTIKKHKEEMKTFCDTDEFNPKDKEFEVELNAARSLPRISVAYDVTELNNEFTQAIQKYMGKIESQESKLNSSFQAIEKYHLSIEEDNIKKSEKAKELRKIKSENFTQNVPFSEASKQAKEKMNEIKKQMREITRARNKKRFTELAINR